LIHGNVCITRPILLADFAVVLDTNCAVGSALVLQQGASLYYLSLVEIGDVDKLIRVIIVTYVGLAVCWLGRAVFGYL